LNASLLNKFKKSTYTATSFKIFLLVLKSSHSLILSAFFHINARLACADEQEGLLYACRLL
jgi:hypothetical protein